MNFRLVGLFDRMISGTAHIEDLTLLTADRNLLDLFWLWPATAEKHVSERRLEG